MTARADFPYLHAITTRWDDNDVYGHVNNVRYEPAVFKGGEEEPAATGWFVHVFVDRATRRPVAFPPRLRAALERLA